MAIDAKKKVELLTEKEFNLIKLIRDMPYGKMELLVKENQPARADVIKESVEF